MREPEWVVLNYGVKPHRMECKRCGARQEVDLPESLSRLVRLARKFGTAHQSCKKKVTP